MRAARASTSCRLPAACGSLCGDCRYDKPRPDFPKSKLRLANAAQRDRASDRWRIKPHHSTGTCSGRAKEYSYAREPASDAESGGTRADESLTARETRAERHEENDHPPLQPWP